MSRINPGVFVFFNLLLWQYFVSYAQPPVPTVYNETYNLSPGDQTQGNHIIKWKEGYLIEGPHWNDANEQYLQLSYYLTDNSLVWQKEYLLPNYLTLQGNCLTAINDFGFYVGGIAYNQADGAHDQFVAKFDENGDSLFFQTYTDTLDGWIVDIEAIPGDTLVVLGFQRAEMDDPLQKIQIWKLDTNGLVLFTYVGAIATLYLPEILERKDPFWLVSGVYRDTPGSSFHYEVFVHKYYNSFGWVDTWLPSSTMNEEPLDLLVYHDTLFLVSEITTYIPGDPRAYWQLQIGTLHPNTGLYMNTTQFGNPILIGGSTFQMNPLLVYDEKLLVYPATYEQNALYYFNTNLDLICSATISPNDPTQYAQIFSATMIDQYHMVTTGRTFDITNFSTPPEYWTVQTDILTHFIWYHCNYLLSNPEEEKPLVTIYPNPASEFLYIQCEIDITEVALRSINGELIYREDPAYGTTTLSVSNYSPGIYLLSIYTDAGIQTQRIVIN